MTMAIDYLIGALIAASTLVNALALGAFWVTPGLRTTANRFVINLLIVNLVGCAALTPSLFGGWSAVLDYNSNNRNDDRSSGSGVDRPFERSLDNAGMIESLINGTVRELIDLDADIEAIERAVDLVSEATVASSMMEAVEALETMVAGANGSEESDGGGANVKEGSRRRSRSSSRADASSSMRKFDANDEGDEATVPMERATAQSDGDGVFENRESNGVFWGNTRHWGFDLTAALGALSMLLIVGDTWCAVTDPLRYHSRVSELKAWIMIALTWSISIAFGIASAFRQDLYVTSSPSEADVGETLSAARAPLNDSQQQQLTPSAQLMLNLNERLRRSDAISDYVLLGPYGTVYDMVFACVYFVVIILLPICLVCGMYWKIFTEAKQNGLRMRQNGSSPLLQSALNLAVASSAASSTSSASSRDSNQSRESQHQTSGGLTMNIDRRLEGSSDNTRPLLTPVHNRKYLEIPKSTTDSNHNSLLAPLPKTRPERSPMTRNMSARHLLLTDHNDPQMRHVRSTPNLQKNLQQPDVIPATHQQQHHSTHHCITVHVPIKALSYMTSIRHRLSNASSIFKYREESRAARISILVVIMFLVSYLPYGMLVLLEGRRITFVPNAQLLAILFVMISNISSPIIFAYRNKRVRRGVCRLFGMDAKTNERLQKRRIATHRHSSAGRNSTGPTLADRSHSRASINSIKYLSPHHCQKSSMAGGGSFILDPSQHVQQTSTAVHVVEDLTGAKQRLTLMQRMYNTSRRLSCASSACSTSSDGSRDSSDV